MTALNTSTGDASIAPDTAAAITWRSGPPLPEARATTVPQLMSECLRCFPTATVINDGGRSATWRDLDEWSARLASAWADDLPRGGRCAILVANGLAHLIAELACWRLGAVAAPIFLGFGSERIAGAGKDRGGETAAEDDFAGFKEFAIRRKLVGKPCRPMRRVIEHSRGNTGNFNFMIAVKNGRDPSQVGIHRLERTPA